MVIIMNIRMHELAFALLVLGICVLKVSSDVDKDWKEFKNKYHKHFKDQSEETKKKSTFQENVEKVKNQNEKFANGKSKFAMKVNKFADEDLKDIKTRHTGLRPVILGVDGTESNNKGKNPKQKGKRKGGKNRNKRSVTSVPDTWDWRSEGVVTPVHDQGGCGSCYAFVATTALESSRAIKTGILEPLSNQFIVDNNCISNMQGCGGGHYYYAFHSTCLYHSGQEIVPLEKCYRAYDETSLPCETSNCTIPTGACSEFKWLPADEEGMKEALYNYGPIAVAIDACSNMGLPLYSNGIFDDDDYSNQNDQNPCSASPSLLCHAVVLVGYGTENGVDYWIARNSWGSDWGEDGYFRMTRNKNMCGINVYAMHPVVY